MRVSKLKTTRYMLFLITVMILNHGCQRYPTQGSSTEAQDSSQANSTPEPEPEPETNSTPHEASITNVMQKARDAIHSASTSLNRDVEKNSSAWTCTKDSSPVVLYNAEHNQLVYCHNGNWKLVPQNHAKAKVQKTHKHPKKQAPKIYQTGHKQICGNGKCRPRTLEDAPAKEQDEFTCRSNGKQSYVCRGR
ncbi:MAG: hypothetical protein AB8C84_10985 [Oligoflexales bacterium]